jgi:hypothetical protein
MQKIHRRHRASWKMAILLKEEDKGRGARYYAIPVGKSTEPVNIHRRIMAVYGADVMSVQQGGNGAMTLPVIAYNERGQKWPSVNIRHFRQSHGRSCAAGQMCTAEARRADIQCLTHTVLECVSCL